MKVQYLDHMGSDRTVLNAARASFDKHTDSPEITEGDKSLLVFLATGLTTEERDMLMHSLPYADDLWATLWSFKQKASHFAPFCHPQVSFRVTAPLAIARQLWKSHIGAVGGDCGYAAWGEQSLRYVEVDGSNTFTPDTFRAKAANIKQGSVGEVKDQNYARAIYESGVADAVWAYSDLLEQDVAPEQARFVLPMATEVTWVWTGSLMFFARLCGLRLDSHAQAESGEVAEAIQSKMSELFPHSWQALMEGKIDV